MNVLNNNQGQFPDTSAHRNQLKTVPSRSYIELGIQIKNKITFPNILVKIETFRFMSYYFCLPSVLQVKQNINA